MKTILKLLGGYSQIIGIYPPSPGFGTSGSDYGCPLKSNRANHAITFQLPPKLGTGRLQPSARTRKHKPGPTYNSAPK